MFSKSLIQFSVDGQGCVPSLLLDLRPSYDEGNYEGLLFLHGLESNPGSSLQTEEEAGLP